MKINIISKAPDRMKMRQGLFFLNSSSASPPRADTCLYAALIYAKNVDTTATGTKRNSFPLCFLSLIR